MAVRFLLAFVVIADDQQSRISALSAQTNKLGILGSAVGRSQTCPLCQVFGNVLSL
jgi:hypothetical protein